ncbi:MAG: hypothetical protein HDT42_08335 [Ruminococcaceae bacterium]|nr:hypothetical protein [Oscillospiraceae bacterium]
MADSVNGTYLSGADQIQANYEKYKDKFVDSNKELVNQETFLKLLVAEMSNQDPLEPTSNTEFISQLATFSSMQYMQDSSKYSMANYASSLAGKTVTATKMEGKKAVIKTGVVEKVVMGKNNTYTLTIDGETYSLSQITSVLDSNDKKTDSGDKTDTVTNSPLGDSIAKAASLVGMYVTVKNGDSTSQGWIDSIKVKDGKITAVLIDKDGKTVGNGNFPIEDITEVTVKYVVEVPQTPNDGSTENSDNTTTDTENTGSTDNTTPDDGGDDVVEDLVESQA